MDAFYSHPTIVGLMEELNWSPQLPLHIQGEPLESNTVTLDCDAISVADTPPDLNDDDSIRDAESDIISIDDLERVQVQNEYFDDKFEDVEEQQTTCRVFWLKPDLSYFTTPHGMPWWMFAFERKSADDFGVYAL
ncbi:hypothetical protein HDU96_006539 [Phlyctochytrium bullatum]|nr:hypothetical protein HDU96_006539 [Phlyctochytrium bullatum]